MQAQDLIGTRLTHIEYRCVVCNYTLAVRLDSDEQADVWCEHNAPEDIAATPIVKR